MPRHEPDADYPCPSAFPWQTGRADSGYAEHLNIRCDAAGILIAVNVPAAIARALVDAHNGDDSDH